MIEPDFGPCGPVGYFLDFSLNPKLEPFFDHVILTQFSSINHSLHTVDPGIDVGREKI